MARPVNQNYHPNSSTPYPTAFRHQVPEQNENQLTLNSNHEPRSAEITRIIQYEFQDNFPKCIILKLKTLLFCFQITIQQNLP